MTSGYSVTRKASFSWISPLLSLLPPTTSLLRLGVEVLLVGLRTLKHGASLPQPDKSPSIATQKTVCSFTIFSQGNVYLEII